MGNQSQPPPSPSSSTSSREQERSPCAACKFLRRKCIDDCIFAPYFPQEQREKFISVHKIFGASNIGKLLSKVPAADRNNTINSLAYEAHARTLDPVYGCVGAVALLQQQISSLQSELEMTKAHLTMMAARSLGTMQAQPMKTIRRKRARSLAKPSYSREGPPPLHIPDASECHQMAKKARTVCDPFTPTSVLCPLPELGGGANWDVSENDEDPLQAFLANFDLPDCTLFDTPDSPSTDYGLLGPSALNNLCF